MKGHTYSKRRPFPREFATDRVYPDFGGTEQATANAANETIALANATRACRGDPIILGSHVSKRMRGGARRAAVLLSNRPRRHSARPCASLAAAPVWRRSN